MAVQQSEEARRYVLERVDAGDLHIAQAAEILGVSERHAWRLLAAYRARGAAALEHGNHGRRPHNAVPDDVAAAVVRFATSRYPGANHTHLAELLWEHEGLELSVWTVRRILARAGIASPRRRRPPVHRVRRERMPREGMLLQVDGSHHAWLEQRAPRFALLLAVDDATGAAVHALFHPVEDARGYFLLMEEVIRRRGIPLALYSDRHGVFKAPPGGRRDVQASSQFARAMRELGVTHIFARSPQAKGRVERAAGTFQDRLVSELSDASASTIPEAQAVLDRFLPRFNARFWVPAAEPGLAYRPLAPALDLGAVLAFRHVRTVARDNTVKYHWRTLQLLPGTERTSYAGAHVEIVERPDGEISVRHGGATIASREAPPRAGTLRATRSQLARNPGHERIASGLGSGGAHRRLPAAQAVPAVEGAPASKPLRAPTPRQRARWKAIQQARLQGLSIRATARLLGISRVTVSNYVRAGGVPGRLNADQASSSGRRD
jgi:transposase